MAVSEQTPYKEYIANGISKIFPLEFTCATQDYLIVTVNDIEPAIGEWSFIDGEVIFNYPPLVDSIIKIWRNSPLARSTTFKTYDNSLNPNSLNFDLDKIWLVMQELNVKNIVADSKLQSLLDSLIAGNVNGLPAEILARIVGDESTKSLVNLEALRAYQAENNLNMRIDNESLIASQNILAEKQRAEAIEQSLQVQVNSVGVGNKAYKTYALMDADKANIPAKSKVTVTNDSDSTNNGDWQYDGTTFTKSIYDSLTQSKNYTDTKIKTFSIYKKIDAYVETVLDVNGFTRIKMQTKSGQTYFYDSRIAENDQSIADLNATVKGVEIYKKIKGQVVTILDAEGFTRIKEQNVTTGQFISYVGAKQKSLVAGTGISILETPETITIEAGAAAYSTPYEYVLCLIAGQSNASYYGGDDALAPNLPNGVCYVWDNTYNTVREINDGSAASKTCKQTYGPAIALEFYKKTGMGLIIVNSAVGSTAQTAEADNGAGNWSPTGTLRQTAIDRFNACRAYLDSISTCFQNGFIVWTQGERDGQEIQLGTITKTQYKTGLSEMIDFFKTNLGLKIPFILTATAYYTSTGDNVGSKSVRSAQYEIAHDKAGSFMGFTGAVKFPSRNLLADGVHYNQAGKNILGTAVGKIAHILSAGVN
ncbi:sialate O-acetylesterase [Acinetobacter sp. TSRC1-2]|uniref:sialate O-acetylesterase n=1 Tax=unclassified Acinetobacter TaxID=196816 RepID=UPI003CE845F7